MKTMLNLGAGNRIISEAVNHDLTQHREEIEVAWDLNELPWPWDDESFEKVAALSVLEHLRQNLLTSMDEIWRILKPGGSLYIGIENRFGYEYFLGKPDDHSFVTYTSLLPRFLANHRMKKKRGRHYRTYTYSYWGLKKLLREAGFRTANIAVSAPDYKNFAYLIPLDMAEIALFFHEKLGFGDTRRFSLEKDRPENRFSKILKRIIISIARLSRPATRENISALVLKLLQWLFTKSLFGSKLFAPSFSAFAHK